MPRVQNRSTPKSPPSILLPTAFSQYSARPRSKRTTLSPWLLAPSCRRVPHQYRSKKRSRKTRPGPSDRLLQPQNPRSAPFSATLRRKKNIPRDPKSNPSSCASTEVLAALPSHFLAQVSLFSFLFAPDSDLTASLAGHKRRHGLQTSRIFGPAARPDLS
jgi:hypothetical protein